MTLPAEPSTAREAAVQVVRALRDAGHVAYFAGGCVRDALLGLTPKDYDVATDAPPERVRSLFQRTQAVGQAFGVVLVRLKGAVIEVATFRTDGTYTDGRRPDAVTFTTAEHDAQRRDFTINGLFYDPVEDHVIDYVGGQADLRTKTLRATGNAYERFAEDHLRTLRAVRFASRFNLRIAKDTYAALCDSAPKLPQISAERIADELRRTLTPTWRDRAYALLFETGIMAAVLPMDSPAERAVDAWRSIFLQLPREDAVPFSLAMLATMLDLGRRENDRLTDHLEAANLKATAAKLRHLLKLSNDELTDLVSIGQSVHTLLTQVEPSVATIKRFLARPQAPAARMLLIAMAAAGFHGEAIARLVPRLESLETTDCHPSPLLTGDDLLAHGFRGGPAFKRVLDDVYDAQLEGRVQSSDEAMTLARTLLRV